MFIMNLCPHGTPAFLTAACQRLIGKTNPHWDLVLHFQSSELKILKKILFVSGD